MTFTGVRYILVNHDNCILSRRAVVLACQRRYIVHNIEPPYSGRLNLTTVALIEAFGVSSETRQVVDLADYMAQYVAEPAEAEVARL